MKDPLLHTESAPHWRRIGIRHHHGFALPLSALHSHKSCGIGEYLDLLPMIDWCRAVGMDLIQLLPLNDSGADPSPYNASSSCALHPLYISLRALPYFDQYPHLLEELETLTPLNALRRVDYAQVLERKIAWLRRYFEKTGAAFIKTPAFAAFVEKNPWVESYALFKTLKERLQEKWMEWPLEFKSPSQKAYSLLVKENWEEICFFIFLQFIAYSQLLEVRRYAAKQKILLKGDIPILISPDSADVWSETSLFDLKLEAGAPPDFYIKEGQNWGFPLFNWEEMSRTHYSWWKRRLSWASHFFDLYRIDHVVGLFRIWGIAAGHKPAEGRFVPEEEALWEPHGRTLLKVLLHASPMLPIAEDLGTIPPAARETLQTLGISGTKVLRWERRWESDESIIPTQEYPRASMSTVSTHDSETLATWWRRMPHEAHPFANYYQWKYTPLLSQKMRKTILWGSHHSASLFHVNLLQEYLACFPELVAADPDEERINIPGTLLSTNWTYRFRPTIEQLTSHPELTALMRQIHA